LTLALLGCGRFGTRQAEALGRLSTARMAAVWDPELARAQRLGRCHGADIATSAEAIWERGDIDGVILATPTATHHDLALAASRAGKHALVAAPVALSLAEFDAMRRAADAAGTRLMVGQPLRFHDVARALHLAVREGDVGEPVFVHWVSIEPQSWPGGWRAWQTDPAQSGGLALHQEINGIGLALWLLDRAPERVYAQGASGASPGSAGDDSLQIEVRCANGANVLIEVHRHLPAVASHYQAAILLGTRGQAEWSTRDESLLLGQSGAHLALSTEVRALRDELEHFVACCQERREPAMTAAQVRAALAAALAANLSLQRAQPVDLANVPGMIAS
jgi:predicted dehydrogenase